MSKEIYRIEIPIETKDKYSKGMEQAKKGVESLEKSADKAAKELSGLEKTAGKTSKESEKLGRSADKAGKDVDKLGTSSKGAAKGVEQVGSSSGRSEKQVSRFQKIVQRSQRSLQRMTGRRWQINLRAVDRASRVIQTVGRFASRVVDRTYRTTFRAVNFAGGVIRGVRKSLLSLPSMITIGLGIVGVGKLSGATVGSAMNFKDYGVSMNHWLDGDKESAAKLMEWMGRTADTTPFTSVDIFPAMTGAVSLAGNNQTDIQRLTSMAIDMASLTPGSTVEDAMQAIQNAKMGEMTMMKRFGFNISKKEMDSLGWKGFMDEIEKRFEGGALALSKTERGLLNTLKGYMQSQFRSMGDGILEPMKPRLQGITNWLMDNEEKWGAWKKTVENAGRQASEWVFSKLETGFNHIRTNFLENKEFQKLDFEGKISFIMDDINQWWSNNGKPALSSWWSSTGQPMAEDLGALVGKAMISGITLAVKEGVSTAFGMWGNTWDTAKEHGVFSKETGKSAIGSLGGTALIAGAGSLLLHPVMKAVKGLFRGGKNIFTTLSGKGTSKTKVSPKPTPQPRQAPTKGFKFPKIPKGLSKLTGRLPLIGPALSALSLIGTSQEKIPGTVGALGGGVAGASVGAAIGSIVPGVGNVVGGIIGGVAGAMGGEKTVTSIQNNWDAIKSEAANIGAWFSDNVWNPAKDGATQAGIWIKGKWDDAKEWVSDKWSNFSAWFDETVWTPVLNTGISSMNFFVGLWDIAREWVSDKWSVFSTWFDEVVWTPVKTGAQDVGVWISDKYTEAKEWALETWSTFSTWFEESVWEPIKLGATEVGQWINDRYTEAKEWIFEHWTIFSDWFDETVWSPVKEGATIAGQWISDKYSDAKEAVSEAWTTASDWFEESVWSPIKTGAEAVGSIIVGAFQGAWDVVEPIWNGIKSAWDTVKGWGETVKGWGGNVVTFVKDTISRGEDITGVTPSYAKGTNYHPGGPAIVGDGGGSELVQFPNGQIALSPSTDTVVDLPRGTKVLPHSETTRVLNQSGTNVIPFPTERARQQANRYVQQYDIPSYAQGIGKIDFEPVDYSTDNGSGATVIHSGTHNEVGDTHVTVVINGSDIDVDDPDGFAHQIADKVAGIVADKVEQVASNMPAV